MKRSYSLIGVLISAALLAACGGNNGLSSSTPTSVTPQTLPGAVNNIAPGSMFTGLGKGPISQVDLLKLQIAGKLPSVFSRAALRHALKVLSSHSRPHLRFRRTARVGLWVSTLEYSYVVGLTASGRRTVSAIDVGGNGCMDPYGIKVDHSENLWVACGFNSSMTTGLVQEYKPGSSTPYATYVDGGCNSPCTSYTATPQDVAFDSDGHVFASNIDSNECIPSCTNNIWPVVWWNADSPSSPPTGVEDPNIIFSGGFLDVDADGNVYTTGYGCIGTPCGYLLDEISDPTGASPTVTNLIPPSFNANLEGVYVSNHGTVLNVTDGTSRTTSQYHLPWTGEAFKTLGPTLLNIEGSGQPVAGGFNYNDRMLALGDAFGWVDIGKVSTNVWSAHTDPDLGVLNSGAAYVPSDK